MRVLRVKLYQEFACYRKPMTYGFWETYPLPPLSTVKGFFHYVVEAKEYIPADTAFKESLNLSFLICKACTNLVEKTQKTRELS
jgi:CRISPR-associated protein, Cas5t family